MAITISTADVKRKVMISSADTTYDSAIGSLISEMQAPLEYSIADCYLADPDSRLQATLKLGILEIISGEFAEQLRRQSGSSEEISVAGISIGASVSRGVDLIQQGATRLALYLKSVLPMTSDTACSNSTSDQETTFSLDEGVW